MQFDEAIFDHRKDVVEHKEDINTMKQTYFVLERNVACLNQIRQRVKKSISYIVTLEQLTYQ